MIIIPDIHGRVFWKDAVKGREKEEIIFLGDYLDPYSDEWKEDISIVRENSIDNFNEILSFKKEHMDNVILLLGNHDCEYIYSTEVCDCRRDRKHYKEIRKIFRDNHKLFDIAYQKEINGKLFILSHAGILKNWLEDRKYPLDNNIVDYLNKLNQEALENKYPEMTTFCKDLSQIDFWRGGYDSTGSIVWGDVRNVIQEGVELYPKDSYQIFGHTLLDIGPIVVDKFACLDCREAFILNNEGEIEQMDGERIPFTKLNI